MPSTDISEEFGRQALVVGGEGQANLRRARVAVVGSGRGGSHVIQQLAYLGVGEILVIDPPWASIGMKSKPGRPYDENICVR